MLRLNCEQNSSVMEDNTADSQEPNVNVDTDEHHENGPRNGNAGGVFCDNSFRTQSNSEHTAISVMHVGAQNGRAMIPHDPLYSATSCRPSIDYGDLDPAQQPPQANIRFGQFNDSSSAASVYGSTHLSLVSARMQSMGIVEQPCDSSCSCAHACPESCRVTVQEEEEEDDENECLPTTQKAASTSHKSVGNKKSLWSCFMPKKGKHKGRSGKEDDKTPGGSSNIRASRCPDVERVNAQVQVGGFTCCSFSSCHNASTSDSNVHPQCSSSVIAGMPPRHHCQEATALLGGPECTGDALGPQGLAMVPACDIEPRASYHPSMELHFYFQRHMAQQSERFFRNPTIVHTQVNYIHCLVPDLLDITNCSFYWGKMDRYEAERLIENKPEGTFLLRDSAQEDYLFSVSFCRHERSLHARIEQSNHKFSFDPFEPGVFHSDTVCGLLEFYKDPSCCMFYDPVLTNPLPRTFPFPLQHLCRATICSRISYLGISQLCLPKTLKHYLKEYHYKQRVSVKRWD